MVITDQYPMYNSVIRAYGYTSNHPALKGRDLGKKPTITGKVPQYFTPGGQTAEVDLPLQSPVEFELQQNYPNPFNPVTTIKYSIPESNNIKYTVYDILWKEVAVTGLK